MSGPRRRGPARRNKRRAAHPRDFWGVPADEIADVEPIVVSDEPHGMVRSLGQPPLPGREAVAGHYFEAVYDKAASLAMALAAAAGQLDLGSFDEADEN